MIVLNIPTCHETKISGKVIMCVCVRVCVKTFDNVLKLKALIWEKTVTDGNEFSHEIKRSNFGILYYSIKNLL